MIKNRANMFLLMLSFVAVSADAKSLYLRGNVHFEDGRPLGGATVVLTQLHGTFLSKPRPLGVKVTDHEGSFKAEIDGAKGTIDIRLIGDRCSWRPAGVQVDVASAERGKASVVELVVKRDICE